MTSSTPVFSDVQQVLASVLAERPRSVRQEVDPSVAALVSVEADMTYLPATLSGLFSQRLMPSLVIIADCSGRTTEPLYSTLTLDRGQGQAPARTVRIEVVRAHGARSYGDAVRRALGYANLPASVRALWLLHDDSRPLDEDCLETLVGTWRDTPAASLLGAKQLDWEGRGLHNVGSYAVKGGLNSLVVDGEPDQEQYDARQDVFAVSLAGALVPLQTLSSLSGLGSWASTFGLSADFCRRACLSGGRVVVAPAARIAHRRARYEGLRGKDGEQSEQENPRDSSMQVIDARESYLYSGHRPLTWPVLWIARLLAAFWFAALSLTAQRPYAAVCELCAPWRVLGHLGHLFSARLHLSRVVNTSFKHLEPLQASHAQVKQWRARTRAYEDQLARPLLSNLARAHLRRLQRIRVLWALGMVVVVMVYTAWAAWPVLKSLFQGGALTSDYLLSSSAGLGQLARAATVPWTWGLALGAPSPPTPFLLLLLPLAVLTGGRVWVAVAFLFFACLPLAALSFWALAGVFTRSNPIRAISGLLWAALAFALPLYADGDLPGLVVLAFLPAAFAFTFRAVGMYHTEQPAQPHPSARSAACASLCFMAVVLAEPQLLLALVVVFILFVCLVVSHRTMLVMIPLPAALAMAPTLVNAVGHWGQGGWRQLFGDVTQASSSRFGHPRAASVVDLVTGLLRVDVSGGPSTWLARNSWQSLAFLGVLALVAAIALVSLCLSSISRVSRLMWFLSIVGAALATVSACVAVGQDWSGPVAGSPLPGLMLALLGLLACVAMIAGGAVTPFTAMNVRWSNGYHAYTALGSATDASELEAEANGDVSQSASAVSFHGLIRRLLGRWSLTRVARAVLAVVLLAILAFCGAVGLHSASVSSLAARQGGLPMVAVDYLSRSESHRVLALAPVNERQVGFVSMRTARGDMVDSSAAAQSMPLSGRQDQADRRLSSAAAALMASADSQAIETISQLGFGGIFVPSGQAEEAMGGSASPAETLTANITGADGTQQVVTGPSGTYFRLTRVDASHQGVHLEGERAAAGLWWRPVWLWSLGLVLLAYCLVALPRWTLSEGSAA
ncbi:putative glycosyltransferase [Bifidobacterium actinocoloniiforme DSM 22766]|uniref:Putative glycosyltransferase n=1 Tax=Bifidobacterium actinocoloniiforme DSM 22766 TaxID=1437605 RepID=A0A086Z026_9BIFI|nr:hypothetical protein [Bifidobacterium actinocoloniiforme]AKV55143.1 hypothetical protein AB656_01485 [Bifidobacterium actinocoloniiforme DSM 22766]KFI39876.1 putative glycosyltransferase [Bifidobacterium actinocoloniiforme DSM 22766]